jgi:1-deoxy-D-xylulose-5-phosphate synthase
LTAERDGKSERRGERLLLARIDGPADLKSLDDDELQALAQEVREYIIDTVGEIGGHFGANLGTCELAVALHSLLDSPRDKVLWDVGHQAYPHKVLTGRRDRLSSIRQYGGLAPFCSREESEHDIMGAGHASTAASYAVGIKEAMRRRAALADKRGSLGHQGGDPRGEAAVPRGGDPRGEAAVPRGGDPRGEAAVPRGGDPRGEAAGGAGYVVAVVGDGAMTGGVAFEALHNAGGLETPIVIVLNDNGMSISPNVGALSRLFNRVRLHSRGYQAREALESGLTRLPAGIGRRIERLGPQLKESLKAFWAPGLFFEELDLAYVGVVDGHDVKALRQALRQALAAERPVVVHIKTVKGKGFAPAEQGGLEGMEKWHAAKPGSIHEGRATESGGAAPPMVRKPPKQYTEVFGKALVDEARRDPRVIGITAAMAGGTGLSLLQRELPDQYYDVGIAEQHAILFAAGLALEGMKPVAAIYSTFLQRAYDQIVHDVCLQKLNVVFCMDRAGLVGDDGPTHHGNYDVSYLRLVPNIVAMAPRDEAMLVRMLRTALLYDEGPIALRYPRGAGTGAALPREPAPIEIGRGELLAEGERVALVGYGNGVSLAVAAAELLGEQGIDATVCDARFAKPLDRELVLSLGRDHELLVTVEENVLAGGLGAAVVEALADSDSPRDRQARVIRFGIPDRYVTHGKPDLLRAEIGLTPDRIAKGVERALEPGGALRTA